MELRLIVAYALIAVVVLLAAGAIVRLRYTTRDRVHSRRRKRERETYDRTMAEREQGDG
jgi:hypothetical protein